MGFRLSALIGAFTAAILAFGPVSAEAAKVSKKPTASKQHKASTSKKFSKSPLKGRKLVKAIKGKQNKLAQARRQQIIAQAMRSARGRHFAHVSMLPSTLDQPSLGSSAAVVLNTQSGEQLLSKNAQIAAPIASITKLMTAIVVLDMHLPLHEPITISEEDVDRVKGSSSRLLVGTTLSRGEMLHLALMSSENRAAHALARTAPGGLSTFIARMNRTATAIGMRQANFADPTGLNSNNVATAEDLTRLVQAANHYPEIREYSTSESYSFISNVNHREFQFRSTNPLVKSDDWEIGIQKTGYINEAGRCLVMQATINGAPTVIVLLDSNGKQTRVGDANRIKRWLETNPAAILRAG